MYAWAAGSYIEAIKITGVPGNWNSPPGECFQGNSWNCVNLRIGYIEVDGYQYTWTKNASGVYVSTRSANPVGGSPFGGNGSNGIQIDKAYLHDAFVSGPTFYRCSNVVTNSLESTRNANWSSGDGRDFPGINHEQNSGTFVHNNPVTNVQGSAAHVYAAGITGSIKLTINNPSWSGGDSRGKGAYIVVIPNKYAGGNSSQLVSDVVVNDANGKPMNYFDAGVAWANPVPANIDKSKTFVLVR
jgi:hypothetical protein